MHLFWCNRFTGTLHPCNEGELKWVPKTEIKNLPIWEGDLIFLKLLEKRVPFFSLKLCYNEQNKLQHAVLNGKTLNLSEVLPLCTQ